jgi:hypothetical protein
VGHVWVTGCAFIRLELDQLQQFGRDRENSVAIPILIYFLDELAEISQFKNRIRRFRQYSLKSGDFLTIFSLRQQDSKLLTL